MCPRCGGSGKLSQFLHVKGGVCFLCNGTGGHKTEQSFMLKHSSQGKYVLNALREDGYVFLPKNAPNGQQLLFVVYMEYGEVECHQTEKFGKPAVLIYDSKRVNACCITPRLYLSETGC